MPIFNSNCTLPPNSVNYVSQPNTRGTFNILWTCLTILFLCTWSVQRPNVPMKKTKEGPQWPSVTKLVSQIFVMLLTLVAPEVLVLSAVENLTSALSLSKRLKERQKIDGVTWSTAHSLFTNMGGFVIQFADDTAVPQTPPKILTSKEPLRDLLQISSTASASNRPAQHVAEDASGESRTNSDAIEASPTRSSIENAAATGATVIQMKPTPSSNPAVHPTKNPTKSHPKRKVEKDLTQRDRRLCRRISIEISNTHFDDKNTSLVTGVLEDLKEEIYTCNSHDERTHSFVVLEYFIVNSLRLRGLRWALNGPQLLLALDMGIVNRMPELSTDDLQDKNKGDFLVKALALIQSGWQIIQLLIRWGKRLPSSQVEIVTVAFSVCAFFIYLISWHKPQNVDTPHIIRADRYPTREELIALAKYGPSYIGPTVSRWYTIAFNALHWNFDGTHQNNFGDCWGWIGATCLGTIFGLLHCAAWNFHFPTPVERVLWRIAATSTASISLILGIFAMYETDGIHPARKLPTEERKPAHSRSRRMWSLILHQGINPTAGFFVITVYALSRIFLMVETFRSLLFLPPRAFLTTI